jgi:hypothetical protein
MATFSVDNFRATVLNKGLAKKNRFEVELSVPPLVAQVIEIDQRDISLLAESAVFPELSINAELQQIWGPAIHRPKSINYGGFMVIQFHLDQAMQIKRLFDTWMQTIVDGTQYTVSYQRDYLCPAIKITQLNDLDAATYSIVLEEAFPAGQVQLDLNHSLQNATHLHTVNFRFRRWYETQAPVTKQTGVTGLNTEDKNSIVRQPASTTFRLLDPRSGLPLRSR